jgi:hypothetical protein
MDLQTSKIELAKLILSIESVEFVEKLRAFVVKEKKDFWDELSMSEQKEINQGIKELDNGDRISFDDYLKKIS